MSDHKGYLLGTYLSIRYVFNPLTQSISPANTNTSKYITFHTQTLSDTRFTSASIQRLTKRIQMKQIINKFRDMKDNKHDT